MVNGWSVYPALGTYMLLSSTGFFIAGFSSEVSALLWLQDYLLRRDVLRMRHERARDRLLAKMQPAGRVS